MFTVQNAEPQLAEAMTGTLIEQAVNRTSFKVFMLSSEGEVVGSAMKDLTRKLEVNHAMHAAMLSPSSVFID